MDAPDPAARAAGATTRPAAAGAATGAATGAASTPAEAAVTIRGLSKRFGDARIYRDFDFDIPRGRFVSVFGPNGCGKSTLINMVAGLIPPDAGTILFAGKTLRETNFSYVFQNYREALFPWLRAVDNIRYPLMRRGYGRKQAREKVDALVDSLGVKLDLNRYPYTMSGGQQQLVSIMRALVTDPEILFLDEPFSALDYEMTLFMRERLQFLFMETGTTMVFVSHDLEEAVFLADDVLLLSRGPARVADYVAIDLPRPRTAETLSEERFVALKGHCLDVFQKLVRES